MAAKLWETVGVSMRRGAPEDTSIVYEFLLPFMEARYLMERDEARISQLIDVSIVAEHEGEIVGFVCLEVLNEYRAELQTLAIDPEFRKLGIAEDLIRSVCGLSEATSKEIMTVTGSLDLFRKMGFELTTGRGNSALFFRPITTATGRESGPSARQHM